MSQSNKTNKEAAILLVCGEGGHTEEMRRLLNRLFGINQAPMKLLSITEQGAKDIREDVERVNCTEVRNKQHGFKLWGLIKTSTSLLHKTFTLLKHNDVRVLLTTGPGLAIPASLLAKFFKVHILHVETNCRFYSKSLTGRFMEVLADDFWIQNEELKALYPNATWCGRL